MRASGRLVASLRRSGTWRAFASGETPRDPRFAAVQDSDLAFFESVLGAGGVVTDPHDLQPFNRCGLPGLWASSTFMPMTSLKAAPRPLQINKRGWAGIAAGACRCLPLPLPTTQSVCLLNQLRPPYIFPGTGWASMRAPPGWLSSHAAQSRQPPSCATAMIVGWRWCRRWVPQATEG